MAKYEDNVQRLLNLLRDTFGDTFKAYYDDDPELIPDFNLPCIVVSEVGDSTDQGAFEQDDVEEELVVKVIFNKKDDFSNQIDPSDMTQRKIRTIISKRDPVTGQYDPKTIKGVIRTFGLQGIVAIANTMTVAYGITPRVDDGLTSEGHVTFRIQYTVDTNELGL